MDEIDAFLERVRGHNGPLSEKYSMVAMRWVDEDKAARLLEDTKSTELAERKNALIGANPKMADAHAERIAKADPDWRERIEDTVWARTKANKLKVAMDVLEMRRWEQQSQEATHRVEMKL